jgi:general transcription factor 3C polypeptide 3 (transcription factor C subunit 4)
MQVSDDSDDSSWAPSEAGGRRELSKSLEVYESSSDESSSAGSFSSSVESSDLDEFIMSTSQSAALSRQRKKSKTKQDGLMIVDEGTGQRKKKKKKKATLATPIGRVSQEVRDLLGQGHNSFLKRDYDTAISLLEEAIRLAPGLADPFVTLGAIYEELNDPKRSLEALLVAVHLTPGDVDLWKRVAIMSQTVGNIDQAIYCFKRCVKAVTQDEAEPFQRDLANLYVQGGRFHESAEILRKIFSNARGEDAIELGTLLAKSLYNINEKPEAMVVLEKLLDLSRAPNSSIMIDANVINMLAEVYLDIREWGRCFSLLTSVLDMDHLEDPEKCPVDLVAKLALAAAPSYQRHASICHKASLCVRSTPVDTHYDLYLLMADGFLANNLIDLALGLLQPALAALESNAYSDPGIETTIVNIKGKTGKCYYMSGDFGRAAPLLEEFVESERRYNRKADPDSLVMLADAWRNTGRELEAGELLLHSLNYEDLLACRTLPTATSTTQRRKWLDTLEHLLKANDRLGDKTASSELGHIQTKFSNTFLTLLNDCELDPQRISRHRIHTAEGFQSGGLSAPSLDESGSISGGRGHITPAARVRKELDLEGVEDVLGPVKFVELVVKGAAVCSTVGRQKEAVELIEAILYNKRKKWNQRSEEDQGQDLIETLENLSFKLSLECGLNKVSTKYLRQRVNDALEAQDIPGLERALSAVTRLMFRPTKKFSQREILDLRSWLVRQACKHPLIYAICLFCGHICVYSQNYRFASQEYMRAHRLNPDDPWPLLCLSSSLLSLGMSRTTRDRQFTILKAFGVLSDYAKKRTAQLGPAAAAEIRYNMGRAFHQLSMWHHADGEYRAALKILQDDVMTDVDLQGLRRVVAYNLSLVRQRAGGQTNQAMRILMDNIVAC